MEREIIYITTEEQKQQAIKEARKTSEAVIEMLRRGMSSRDIAEATGVTPSFVSGLAKIIGMPTRSNSLRDYYNWVTMRDCYIKINKKAIGDVVEQFKIISVDRNKKQFVVEYGETE